LLSQFSLFSDSMAIGISIVRLENNEPYVHRISMKVLDII
jgi:hypothetical protein